MGWVSDSKPKWDWGTFWNSATSSLGEETKKTLSTIGTAISTYSSIILGGALGVGATVIGTLFNVADKKQTGWIQDKDGKWYYYDPNGQMQTGWQEIDNKWYYLNTNGQMKTGWMQDNGTWYYLDKESGKMATG